MITYKYCAVVVVHERKSCVDLYIHLRRFGVPSRNLFVYQVSKRIKEECLVYGTNAGGSHS